LSAAFLAVAASFLVKVEKARKRESLKETTILLRRMVGIAEVLAGRLDPESVELLKKELVKMENKKP
jgi:hypothetical protein